MNEANIIPFGIFSWHATSWITWGDIWDWPILYRLLSLSYNQRRALHIVPIVVELPVSTSLFISFVLFSCYIVFILIQSIRRYEVNENGLSSLCRCNISVAFVLQMWRAESLKAGAGSRSKAAKPCPPHPRLSATMLWARGEWASGRRRVGGGGGQSCLHGNLKHGVTDVIHPAVRLLSPASLSCYPLPHCPVHPLTVPVVPNACSRSLIGPVCMAYGPFYRVALSGCCSPPPPPLVFKSLDKTSHSAPAAHRFPLLHKASHAVGDCWVKKSVFAGCLLLLHGFGVALKSFPLACRDPGVLLCSLVTSLSLLVQLLIFNFLLSLFSISFPSFIFLNFLFQFSLLLFACLGLRERWPWSCVSEA